MDPIIIQWNSNGLGLRAKLGELERLLVTYNPICLCIQHVGKFDRIIKNYKLASQSLSPNGELGTAIYVHNLITYDMLQINGTSCQPSAITLYVPGAGKINLLNLYNQPIFNYSFDDMTSIVESINHPKIVVGDLNSHNPIWDSNCKDADRGGNKIEELMNSDNLMCLNEETSHTFVSKIHMSKTSVDLTLCSLSLVENLEWHVLEDSHTSDHYPVVTTIHNAGEYQEPIKRFKTKQADWISYRKEIESIPEFDRNLPIEESYSILKNAITEAATKHIPMTKGNHRRKTVPWWSKDLQKQVDIKHKLTNTIVKKQEQATKIRGNIHLWRGNVDKLNKIEEEIKKLKPECNKAAALFKRMALKAKRDSWRNYIEELNSNTPMKKIWKRFGKINGSQNKHHRHAITYQGRRLHETSDVGNAFGEHLQKVSSDESYSEKFKRYKRK